MTSDPSALILRAADKQPAMTPTALNWRGDLFQLSYDELTARKDALAAVVANLAADGLPLDTWDAIDQYRRVRQAWRVAPTS